MKTICNLEVWPEDLKDLATAAGMRIVARSGHTPVYYEFVPDVSRAGEMKWVETHEELRQAMVPDPAQEPVVLLKEDLSLVMTLADAYLNVGMYFSPEQKDAFDRVFKILQPPVENPEKK